MSTSTTSHPAVFSTDPIEECRFSPANKYNALPQEREFKVRMNSIVSRTGAMPGTRVGIPVNESSVVGCSGEIMGKTDGKGSGKTLCKIPIGARDSGVQGTS
jgi:hypothetical protein